MSKAPRARPAHTPATSNVARVASVALRRPGSVDDAEGHRGRGIEALDDLVHHEAVGDGDAVVVPAQHDLGVVRAEARVTAAGSRHRDRGSGVRHREQREGELDRRELAAESRPPPALRR